MFWGADTSLNYGVDYDVHEKTGIGTGKRGHIFLGKPVGPREDRAKITFTQTRCFPSPNVPIGDSG
jgi:hypothetical protein